MRIGIFSKIFSDYNIDEAFKRIKDYGFRSIQFNMENIGMNSMPTKVNEKDLNLIENTIEKYDLRVPVISGTFNTLELYEEKRKLNFERFENLLDVAEKLNIKHISISTGSLNQEDFWSPHPDNRSEEAWNILFNSLDIMLELAENKGITIVIEPEQANVIQNVDDVLRLFDHYKSDYLKVLYDPANVMTPNDEGRELEKIKETLNALGSYIAVAHLKDFDFKDNKVVFASVGKGKLPIKEYLDELSKNFDGDVIMHGLELEEIEYAIGKIEEGGYFEN